MGRAWSPVSSVPQFLHPCSGQEQHHPSGLGSVRTACSQARGRRSVAWGTGGRGQYSEARAGAVGAGAGRAWSWAEGGIWLGWEAV